VLGARITLTTAVIAGAALLAGCSSSGSGHGSVFTSPSTPATTSSDTAANQPSGSTTTTSGSTAAPDLQSQLIALGDLPSGWAVDNSDDDSGDSDSPSCFKAADGTITKMSEAHAEANFAQSGGLPVLDEEIGYEPNGEAASNYTKAVAALSSCKSVSFDGGGTSFTGSMGQMSFEAVGSQSTAYTMNLSADNVGIVIDLVIFQVGDDFGVIEYGDLSPVDASDFQQYVDIAKKKLPS
jgi:hypothetical protein